MVCDKCNRDVPTTGAILWGKFGQYCRDCRNKHNRSGHAGHAQWSRDRDREDNAKDLIQPFDRNGNPNREFIRNYPEESKDMFTEEELKNHG